MLLRALADRIAEVTFGALPGEAVATAQEGLLHTFGAAAACAHLLRLSPDKIATALALAASMASGIKANFGTMTKPFHVGHAARNGLFAALLAEEGMTANHGALEHKQGFFAVFNGEGNFDADRILAEWAKPFDLAD